MVRRRATGIFAFAAALLAFMSGGSAQAQNKSRGERDRPPGEARPTQRDRSPAARRSHGPRERPQRSYPRQFDVRPQFYRDGYGYRFGIPAFDQRFQEELDRAYQRGVEDGRDLEHYNVQVDRGVTTYNDAMAKGNAAFEAGNYGLAVRLLLLAATLNQGDPVSRLAASHALVAQGAYEPAERILRRAFELEPRLVYLPLEIRGAYGNPEHFARHLAALRKAAENDTQNPGLWFLLGYYGYYSDHMADAADALEHAAKLAPSDGLIQQLADLARMSVPRNPSAPQPMPLSHNQKRRTRTDDR